MSTEYCIYEDTVVHEKLRFETDRVARHSIERAVLDENIRNNCRLKHRIKKSSLTWNKIRESLQRFESQWRSIPQEHMSAVSQPGHEKRHKNALCPDSVALVPLSV